MGAGLVVSDAAGYVDHKLVSVSNGSSYVSAKASWVSLGGGLWAPVPINHYHEYLPAGGDIQAAMDRAYTWFLANRTVPVDYADESSMACVELESGGAYTTTGSLYYRRGVRLIATGATVTRTGASTANMLVNSANGGGGYSSPHRDWLILGGTFDCAGIAGGISTAHTARFRLDGVTIKNGGGVKHLLEINSSGGARSDGTYNCEVLNCTFFNTTKPATARTEDEAIQLDYSWTGAAPAVANDGTMTNNVRIEGNLIYNMPRAIGGHHYQAGTGGEADPDGLHSNILIKGNTIRDIDPQVGAWGDGANGSGSEGAVRAYTWNNVIIENNTFLRCYQPVNTYISADAFTANGSPTTTIIRGNTITDKTSTRPGIRGTSAHASLVFNSVLVEDNLADGTWGGTDYYVGVDNTASNVPGFSQSVVMQNNTFSPSNKTLAEEQAYNKYRAANATNTNGVLIQGNKVSDGSVSNT